MNTGSIEILSPQFTRQVTLVVPGSGPISLDNPMPVSFGSGSINITAEVTNTQLEISNDIGNPIPVTISGSLGEISSSITNFPELQQVTGSVIVSNLPTIQSVIVTNFPSSSVQQVTGSVIVSNLITGSSTEAKQDITNNILNTTTGSLFSIDKNTVIFYTEDIEEDTSISTTYIGKQSNSGTWLVQKVVESTVGTINTTLIEYATVLNNPTVLTYTNAWSGRATLIYSQIKNLL